MSPEDTAHRFVIGTTDPDWFAFLKAHPELQEINFWRPGGGVSREPSGTPWFFRVRGTTAIYGCGFVSTSYQLPIVTAWDTFGIANGFEDYGSFAQKMAELQRVPMSQLREIGCIVLTQPLYFQKPIHYERMYGPLGSESTLDAEGAALWSLLVPQIQLATPPTAGTSALIEPPKAGYGAPTLVTPRIGQKSFRVNVTRAYTRQCAITKEKTLPALEAAHIRQFAQAPSHATTNGILLRSDIHHLFDQGYVSIRPDLVFRVSKTIRDEFSNGRDYYALDGLAIREPEQEDQRPDRDALDWHYSTLFRG